MARACRSYSRWATDISSTRVIKDWFDIQFKKALEEIDPKSTPGYCILSVYGTTNGEILKWDGFAYDPERVRMFKEVVYYRFQQLLNGENVADDIKVFVKQEPHKLKKLAEGRVRLISAVSLIDSTVDRILFGWLGRAVLNSVGYTPCLVGWSPVRGGWIPFQDRFRGKPTNCLDKEAWDWTVTDWLVDVWLEVVLELGLGHAPWWADMVRLRFKILFEDCVFRFEDGTRVRQGTKGIMKSGCFLTIILNSLGQSILHYAAMQRMGHALNYREPLVLGDDTVQEAVPELELYVQHLEQLGARVKGAKVMHFVEFAGFAYDGQFCYPAYWQKHLFNMAHSDNLREMLPNYQYLYVHEPVMYEFICRVAREVCPDAILPRCIAIDIMDFS